LARSSTSRRGRRPQIERLESRELLAANLVGQWRAEDLSTAVADGGTVAAWPDLIQGASATAVGRPALIKGALGGRAVVRFDPEDGTDAFRVTAAASPMSGAGDFTIALVFATGSTALQGGRGQWFQNTGLIDANLFGAVADWGLVVNRDGQVGAGLGLPAVTQYSSATGLNDGSAHVVIYARTAGTISLYVDGQVDRRTDGSSAPRAVFDMTFGSLQSGALAYSGDIAEIRFYDGDFDDPAAQALTTELTNFYRNAPPIAVDDQVAVDEDTTLVVAAADGLLNNDTDAESDSFVAILQEGPRHGTVELAPDGGFVYRPATDFFGEDQFTYVARDFADSNTATVTIDVRPVPDPPVAVADTFLLAKNFPLRLDVTGGVLANDVNRDQIALTVSLVEDVSNGELDLKPDGSFVYQPQADFVGTDHFTYRVRDGTHDTEAVRVDLDVIDQAVVISEVMTNNVSTLPTRTRHATDAPFSGEPIFPDWIELRNLTSEPFDLSGHHLTDRANKPDKWSFPDGTTLPARGRIVVFASGKDVRDTAFDERGALHTSFTLNAAGEYLAITDPQNRVVHLLARKIPRLAADLSYGLTADGLRFFTVPTPGGKNGPGLVGAVAGAKVSVPSGFFDAPFQLEISSETAGATLVYTLDGSEPDATNGTVYQGPLTITKTSVLRVVAIKPGFIASPIATETYLFLNDVIAQPGMDRAIVNSPLWRPQLIGALTQIPSLSLVTDSDNLYDPTIGIIANPDGHGRQWERPAALELLNPDGSDGFRIDLGLRIRGGFSRGADKSSFRFFFREAYGAAKLRFPFFGDEGTDTFDKIDLRTAQNYSWSLSDGDKMTFVRDLFSRLTQGELNQPYERGRFYHLYINGQYWGLYQTDERAEASYGESYLGGSRDDFDVVKATGRVGADGVELTDGKPDAFYRMWQAAVDGFTSNEDYFRIQGFEADGVTRNPDYERLLDVDNLIDYMIITYYTGDKDGPGSRFTRPRPNNFFGIYNRRNPDGFKWFEHDSEHSLDTGVEDIINPLVIENPAFDEQVKENFNPHWLHEVLMVDNAEYRQRFADRLHLHFATGGQLTDGAAVDRIDRIAGQIDQAIIAESARWGRIGRTKTEWSDNVEKVRTWVRGRTDVVIDQLRGRGWYPAVDSPAFGPRGGRVEPGVGVEVTAGEGVIYYTTDGTDPRLVGGAVNPRAIPIQSGDTVPLAAAGTLNARLFQNGTWSPLNTAEFTVGVPADGTNLRISEIHYNPAPATAAEIAAGHDNNDDFEFIELVNISEQTIDLTGVQLVKLVQGKDTEGVDFDFSTGSIQQLGAGQRVLVVENTEAFALRYGGSLPVAGAWSGRLSNKQEQLTLVGDGQTIQQFAYKDRWHPATDGGGPSLEIIDVRADLASWSEGGSWRPSGQVGGTPGTGQVRGDVNQDGVVDARDIDRLYAEIAASTPALRFDLTRDGQVDQLDLDELVQNILGTDYGDVNLDGKVDRTDLNTVFGQFTGPAGSGKSWASGDLDGDGDVDNLDLNVAVSNASGLVGVAAMAGTGRAELRRSVLGDRPSTEDRLRRKQQRREEKRQDALPVLYRAGLDRPGRMTRRMAKRFDLAGLRPGSDLVRDTVFAAASDTPFPWHGLARRDVSMSPRPQRPE